MYVSLHSAISRLPTFSVKLILNCPTPVTLTRIPTKPQTRNETPLKSQVSVSQPSPLLQPGQLIDCWSLQPTCLLVSLLPLLRTGRASHYLPVVAAFTAAAAEDALDT